MFIEAEPHFGVKIILCLNSELHNKQEGLVVRVLREVRSYLLRLIRNGR